MKRVLKVFICICLFIVPNGFAVATDSFSADSHVFQEIILSTPQNEQEQDYLGVKGKGTFTIPQIKAEIVIIQIFSMY